MSDDKKADLAGPGISSYPEVAKILPTDYASLQTPMETMKALFDVKRYIEDGLARELNLQMIQVPLIVTEESGFNDMLDRDGSRTPVTFPCGLGISPRLNGSVVQAATKWKRWALKQFGCEVGQGICTDMKAVRKDYFLDHDHSSYVDQWDWERVMRFEDRNLDFLKDIVGKIWKVLYNAQQAALKAFPQLNDKYENMPEELVFLHAEEILDMYPTLPRKMRETEIIQKHPAIFIIGIGHTLEDGYPHEMRAADYDDWTTPTIMKDGKQMHGLNGDILVWNDVTHRRHELTSMGIRVTKETLVEQLKITGQEDFLNMPYHRMILNDEIPLSVGGGLGQSRIYGYILKKAALGECSVTVWPEQLHKICAEHNIHLLK